MNEQEFDRLWRESTAATFAPTEEEENLCSYAQHFAVFAEGLVREEARGPTHIGVNQKMLLVTKKCFEWRAVVPTGHRDRISKRSHTCIFHVFERLFMQLKALELSLAPPMLFLPPPPSPPAPPPATPEYLGITLGEVLGEE